ncbi:MAG: PPOX class F420-dependent oxidoreductase [Dehalococcoidia bacterium]
MTPDDRTAFLSEPRTAVLSTVDAKGRAHAVPVWFRYVDGTFRIITDRGSAKTRNIERTGRASLCVDEREGAFRYVTGEGPAAVEGAVSYEERLALHTHYRGAEAAKRIVDGGGHERMVIIVVRPERWLPSG